MDYILFLYLDPEYIKKGCIINTWRFFKWNNFLRQSVKMLLTLLGCIPYPSEFILVIIVGIWHFVCDHHVIQYTPAVAMERLS